MSSSQTKIPNTKKTRHHEQEPKEKIAEHMKFMKFKNIINTVDKEIKI